MQFKTKGSFRINVKNVDGGLSLSIVTKWGNEVIAHLTNDQAAEIAARLVNRESVTGVTAGQCQYDCSESATYFGPDPYALEILGQTDEIRACEGHVQARRDDI